MKHAYIEYDSSRINEDWFEKVIIEHLVDSLGYDHLYGPDVRRSSDDYRDVFLPDVLPDALARINKGLPSAAIDEAILKISNVEGGTLEQRNETFNDYLQSGVEVRYFDGEQDRDEIVRLLDFDDPGNNDFHVVNQWTFVEYSEKRPDVIVFVNGMLTNAEVIEELVKMAKDMMRDRTDAEKLGLNDEEMAFYDAITKPEAVKDFYDNDQLVSITRELTETLQRNATIDWQKKESARAGMRRAIKRLLRKYKYPPEGVDDAMETVMEQCELWADTKIYE